MRQQLFILLCVAVIGLELFVYHWVACLLMAAAGSLENPWGLVFALVGFQTGSHLVKNYEKDTRL